ncbi:hypothetical protein D3C86_1948550 [compost metagenome]
MLNREQNVIDRAIDAALRIVRLPSAGSDNQHRAFTGEGAFTITIPPTDVRVFADAIGKSVGIDAFNPAFKDRRHRKPPQRELQDHRIGPQQLFLFQFNIFAL